jgi:hypothetical protein
LNGRDEWHQAFGSRENLNSQEGSIVLTVWSGKVIVLLWMFVNFDMGWYEEYLITLGTPFVATRDVQANIGKVELAQKYSWLIGGYCSTGHFAANSRVRFLHLSHLDLNLFSV